VKNFFGVLTNSGILDITDHLGASTPEEYLGCKVLMRGYIADKVELSRCLGLKPSTRTSDVELMSYAFRKWGRSFQSHVLGEFAAVIFDMQTKTGLLTHDALGLVPLFYTQKPNGLFFSTDILDIVDNKSSEALDQEYLADLISIGFITGDRTPYSRVRRLLPGRSLWWFGGQFEEIKTWNLADLPAVRCSNDLEYEEQFRSLLEAGVQASLDEQGVNWIALSGGVDSSSRRGDF
jgi:asparagine synthase (glutamine-hydrolysing)